MRLMFLLALLSTPLCADPFRWDDSIFPPDEVKTIEQKRIRPMVAHKKVSVSGSNTGTSTTTQNRSKKSSAQYKDKNNNGGWQSRRKALEKKEGEDYKDR